MIDSRRAWWRLAAACWLATVGTAGMWSVVVVLPAVQAEFGISRSEASLPYTLTLVGFAAGQYLMGRLTDRFGAFPVMSAAATSLALGYLAASQAASLWQYAAIQGVLIGLFGSSATFGPLIADTSLWFRRYRGLAVAICASGSYLGGTIAPPVMQHFIDAAGWRATYVGMGLFCLLTMLPVALALRARPPRESLEASAATASAAASAAAKVPASLRQALLALAAFACCMAMAMPQVHIVAYCGDLGYGPARGAEMLSLMLGFGIVSRLASGWIADRIGGLRTLLLGSALQGVALSLYLVSDALVSLYVVSALFGLFQGGIVPSYAIIVREQFAAREAGRRVGLVMVFSLGGMAVGGWATGLIFDLAGSYRIAFLHGIGWNFVNLAICLWLMWRGPLPAIRRSVQSP